MLSSRLALPPPLGAPGAPHPDEYRIPMAPEDAECLLGLNLRMALREVLATVHRERPLDAVETPFALLNRNAMYREIDAIGLEDYAEKILPGQYPEAAKEELFRLSGLRSLERQLADDPRLRVIHSWNDPLLTEDDARFLDRALGGRLVWVSGGGHLGELCADAVQKKIIALAEPEPERPAAPASETPAGSANR